MKITAIRKKAKKLGINSGKMEKTELIHAIQKAEGNVPCFGQVRDSGCPYTDCCFREDCLN